MGSNCNLWRLQEPLSVPQWLHDLKNTEKKARQHLPSWNPYSDVNIVISVSSVGVQGFEATLVEGQDWMRTSAWKIKESF